MSCGVYKVTNKITGECYVGSSKNIEKRWKNHKSSCYHKKQPGSLLYKAMDQYGIANFQFDILEECSEDNLKQLEDKYIRELMPAYNKVRAYAPEWRTSEGYNERYNSDLSERERRKRNSNAWKARNREKARAAVRRWQENHPERVKELNERWKAEHQDKKEYDAQWRAEHPDYMKDYKKSEEYKAKNREASRRWRERKKAEMLLQKQI